MSIRYGMDAVPGKITSVSYNDGKKQLCFVIEDIGGRRFLYHMIYMKKSYSQIGY